MIDREQAQFILSRTFSESTPKTNCGSTPPSPATASSHSPQSHLRAESAPLHRYNSEPKILIPASPKATTPKSNFGTIFESSQDISSVRALYSSEPSRHVSEGLQPEGFQPVSPRGYQPRLESQALIPHSRYQSEAHTKLAASVMGLKGRSYNGDSLLSSGGGGLDSVLRARHNSAKSMQMTKPPTPAAAPVVPSLPLLKNIDLVAVLSHSSNAPLVPQQQQQQRVHHRIQQHILQQAQQQAQPLAQQQAQQQMQQQGKQQAQQHAQQQVQQPQLFKPLPGPSESDNLHSWLASLNQSTSPRPPSHNPPANPPLLRYPSTRSSQSSHPGVAEQNSPSAHHPHSYHEHVHEQETRAQPQHLPSVKRISNSSMEQKLACLTGDNERCSPPQRPSQSKRPLTHKQELAACLESQRHSASPLPPQRFTRTSHGLDGDYGQANLAPERRTPPRANHFQTQINLLQAQLDLDIHADDFADPETSIERKTPPSRRSRNHALDLSSASLSPHDVTHPPTLATRPRAPRISHPNFGPKPYSRPITLSDSLANELLNMDIRMLSESSDSYPPLYPCTSNSTDALPVVRMTLDGMYERYPPLSIRTNH